VRIAVHTGESELRYGDYYGPAVNHCARLRGIAHGGQVLVSELTADLVRESLARELSLRDLGHHQLKDLERPERVWQLLHPRLPADFPPLISGLAKRHNLPNQLSSFVGRRAKIAEIRRLLAKTRLLTVAGPGGVGKTRLAIAVAEAVQSEYPDGVWLVELASLTDPALVPSAVARTLGVRESNRPLIEQLAEAIRPRAMLIVLDNCEHVVHACAALCERLLLAARDVQILATSRRPLAAQGEVLSHVPGLALPRAADDPTHTPPTEAVQLFVERAVAITSGFRLTENHSAVVDICRQLDGNPLAIELAAAYVKVLTADQIAARMGDRFRLLVSAGGTAPPRHQTLRTAVDWSYGLLSSSEQTLFNRLSVFAGGCTLDAVERVCAGPEVTDQVAKDDVLSLISRLIDQSLLETYPADGTIRFRLLETLRSYASERLREAGEAMALRNRHLEWCLTIADSIWSGVDGSGFDGAKEADWLPRVEREHDNMRAALAWALENRCDAVPALRLAGDMYFFWWRRGHVSEGRGWLARAFELDARVGPNDSIPMRRARVRALRGAGVLARTQSDYADADAMFSASVALARELDDAGSVAHGLSWLASDALVLGKEAQAQLFADESAVIYRELAVPEVQTRITRPLETLASLAWRHGDYQRARVIHEERLRYARNACDPWLIASISVSLGQLAYEQREHDRAKHLLEASRVGFCELGDRGGMAWATIHIGHAARARGDAAQAKRQFTESLKMFRELGALWGVAESLEGLAVAARDLAHCGRAAQLFGSAAALRQNIGYQLAPPNAANQQRDLDALRATLGLNGFETAWRMGRDLPLDEAIDVALATDSD
jgi:predicted ATPase